MEDNDIVKLFWERNESALIETNKKYGAYCYSIAFHILSDKQDSEECVNDTWLKAWKTIPPQRPKYLQLFLAKIVRNLSFDRWRHNTAQKRQNSMMTVVLEELQECIPDNCSTEDAIIEKELQGLIHLFLHSLSPRDRSIFLKRYFYVETVKFIAEEHHLTENHVSAILHRTKKKLRQYLERNEYYI